MPEKVEVIHTLPEGVTTVSIEMRALIERCLEQARVGNDPARVVYWENQLSVCDLLLTRVVNHV